MDEFISASYIDFSDFFFLIKKAKVFSELRDLLLQYRSDNKLAVTPSTAHIVSVVTDQDIALYVIIMQDLL